MNKMNNKDFDIKLKDMYDGRVTRDPNDDYVNTKTRIKLICLDCNNHYSYIPYNLFNGYRGCPKCSKRRRNMSLEDIKERILSETDNHYEYVSGEYIGVRSYVFIKHIDCGYIWESKLSNFFQGKRCPICMKCKKKTLKDVVDKLEEMAPNNFRILSTEYISKDKPLEFECLKCNNKVKLSYNNIRSNRFGCKFCRQSTGEKLVSDILNEGSFNYNYLTNLGRGRSLEFDFSIQLNDKMYLIEYDGRQHYLPIFGDDEADREVTLKRQIKKDKFKDKYCEENNIPLLRIPYTKDYNDIKELITYFLK
jgi:Zn finger protein HypA/HybF involved in hydrogenase expression